MGFNEDLAALLEANTTYQPGGTSEQSGEGSSWVPNYDPEFEAGNFGNFVLDTTTGDVITLDEAMRRDPSAASDILRGRGTAGANPGLEPATLSAASPSPANTGGILSMIKDNKDLIGLALAGGTAALGIGSAIAGLMSDTGDGGARVALPDGRTLTLSPQEKQLLDMAVEQAANQGKVSAATLQAMGQAATENAGALKDVFGTSIQTAASQLKGTKSMSNTANAVLFGGAGGNTGDLTAVQPTIDRVKADIAAGRVGSDEASIRGALGALPGVGGDEMNALVAKMAQEASPAYRTMQTDLKNEEALQGVQTSAISNLADLVDTTPTDAQKLGTKVGMAADTEALRLAEGGALDPSLEALRPTGEAARQTVTDYISGQDITPGMYGDENDIRATANARLKAGLTSDQIANPAIARQVSERFEQLQAQMLRDLGPGWEASTPGQRALNDFNSWKNEQIYGSNLADTSAMSSIALPRAQFLEGVQSGRAGAAAPLVTGVPQLLNSVRMGDLSTYAGVGTSARAFDEGVKSNNFARNTAVADQTGRATSRVGQMFGMGQSGAPTPAGGVAALTSQNPGSLAVGAMGNLSTIANFQQGTENQNAITAALLEAQRKRDLLSGGGQLIGNAISPFLSAASKSFFS